MIGLIWAIVIFMNFVVIIAVWQSELCKLEERIEKIEERIEKIEAALEAAERSEE